MWMPGAAVHSAPVDGRRTDVAPSCSRCSLAVSLSRAAAFRGGDGDGRTANRAVMAPLCQDAVGSVVLGSVRWVSMTIIDGAGSRRRAAVRATACRTVSARVHVPLADQRRNWDHTRVQAPKHSVKKRH